MVGRESPADRSIDHRLVDFVQRDHAVTVRVDPLVQRVPGSLGRHRHDRPEPERRVRQPLLHLCSEVWPRYVGLLRLLRRSRRPLLQVLQHGGQVADDETVRAGVELLRELEHGAQPGVLRDERRQLLPGHRHIVHAAGAAQLRGGGGGHLLDGRVAVSVGSLRRDDGEAVLHRRHGQR